jgi:hypothetical protein
MVVVKVCGLWFGVCGLVFMFPMVEPIEQIESFELIKPLKLPQPLPSPIPLLRNGNFSVQCLG